MQEAVDIVEGLTNVQSIRLLKQLNRNLYKAVSYQNVETHLLPGIDEVEMLRGLEIETKKQNIDPEKSVEATKHVLMAFAQDDDLAPVLIQAWEEIKSDDSLIIETIIAVGLVANLTLFLATTEIEFKVGGLTIKKGKADASILKEIMNPITELIKNFSFKS